MAIALNADALTWQRGTWMDWQHEATRYYQRIGQWVWECAHAAGKTFLEIERMASGDGFAVNNSRLSRLASLRHLRPDQEQTQIKYIDLLLLMYLNTHIFRRTNAEMMAYLESDSTLEDMRADVTARSQAEGVRTLMNSIHSQSLRNAAYDYVERLLELDRRQRTLARQLRTGDEVVEFAVAHLDELPPLTADQRAMRRITDASIEDRLQRAQDAQDTAQHDATGERETGG